MDFKIEKELIKIKEAGKSSALSPECVMELEIRASLAMYGRGVKKSGASKCPCCGRRWKKDKTS